jgi:hypothetical protein
MIVSGSMRYSPSGRKRKTNAWKKTVVKSQARLDQSSAKTTHRQTKEYPSMQTTKYSPSPDNSWKVEESKNFTVAPAYNKGAYQVIPRSDVKHIGK